MRVWAHMRGKSRENKTFFSWRAALVAPQKLEGPLGQYSLLLDDDCCCCDHDYRDYYDWYCCH